MKQLILLLSFLFIQSPAMATNTYFCGDYLEKMPIQQGGRVKPLLVHSKEIIKYLTGKTKVNGLSAVETYCLINLQGMGISSDIKLETPVDHVELKKLLDFKDGQKKIAFADIDEYADELKVASVKNKNDTSFGKAIRKIQNKRNLFADLLQGNNWVLPEVNGSTIAWVPINAFLQENKVAAKKASGDPTPFKSIFIEARANYEKIAGTGHITEHTMTKLRLTSFSLLFCIIALALLFSMKKSVYGLTATGIAILLQTAYITFRVYISGRAPITNMYETVLFSGYGGLILSLIICSYRKEKIFIFLGLTYNVLTLMMLLFSGGMLSPAIGPLVPVLRDNFWLSTHVTTVILSYGAYALSWVLANYVLIKSKFGGVEKSDMAYYVDLMYTCLKYGSIMLAAGLLLGGVWADYSWGRFWGWDPKETWSLIVLCFYMAILHGKYTTLISNKLFVPLTALCFLSVMMAWFGVNYILASGLHSYGFSEGGAIFLGTFFLVQIVIVIVFGRSFFDFSKFFNKSQAT